MPAGCGFLVVELGGATLDEARGRGEALMQQARRMPVCTGSTLLTDPIERDSVWRLRESGLGAGAARVGFPRTWPGAEDVAVAPAKLGAYLRRFTKLLDKRQLRVSIYYGHFGEGCVHCRVSFDLMSPEGIATFRATMEELGDLVVVFEPVQPVGDAARHAADHGADQAVFLQGREIIDSEELNGLQAHFLPGLAHVLKGNLAVTPFADRVMEGIGHGGGHGVGVGRFFLGGTGAAERGHGGGAGDGTEGGAAGDGGGHGDV